MAGEREENRDQMDPDSGAGQHVCEGTSGSKKAWHEIGRRLQRRSE